VKTTVIGEYNDFAVASRVAAELMVAGFAQAEISIVGRAEEAKQRASRFVFAGALARDLAGARENDFKTRLVTGLARLCVPPREATRQAEGMIHGGGLVAIQAEPERARRAESVMRRQGRAESYAAGALPMMQAGRVRNAALAAFAPS